MRLPSFKQLYSTDYKATYKDLIDQLSLSLNNGITILYTALTNNLTFRDNFNATINDITVTVDSTGKPTSGGSFQLKSSAKIDGLLILSALNQTNSNVYPTSGVFITGAQSGTTYNISNITGLQAGQSYTIRVIVPVQ